MDYFDPQELSYMWGWIKGNKKWHAWNKFKGLSKEDAVRMYIENVEQLVKDLPNLIEEWKDDQDPRVPDKNAWVPSEEMEERRIIIEEAKRARRERDAIRRKQEEEAGMWDE